jgi:hypothetical protein
MTCDYVTHGGKRLFVIEVQRSAAAVSLGGKSYVRTGQSTVLTQAALGKAIWNAGIDRLPTMMWYQNALESLAHVGYLCPTHRKGKMADFTLVGCRRPLRS